jgi:ABC-type Zn uptake system ZnuABC Zn-binding protein ZnuA
MKIRAFLATLFLSAACVLGAPLEVLTTFPPIDSLTRNVAGNAAHVEMLLPPSVGPHDFALAPSDLRKIAAADVIVSNGLGIESWLQKALDSNAKKGALDLVASKGLPPEDPHVWLDPVFAIKMVENIRDGLKAKDPANAEIYAKNAAAYIEKLKQLDAEIRAGTESLPNKRLLPFHESFNCFAKRYGFEVVASIEEFPGKEPTPKYLAKVRKLIASKNVKVLFTEPQYSPQIVKSLSADLGVPIAVIDPMEVGEPGPDLYEKVMRANLKAITEALK